MWNESGIAVALALCLSSAAFAEWDPDQHILISTRDGFIECFRASKSLVMKDQGYCPNKTKNRANDKAFCLSSARCYPSGLTGGSASWTIACRANWTSPIPTGPTTGPDSKDPGGKLTCPTLDECAKDQSPDLMTEQEAQRPAWGLADDVIEETPHNKPAPAAETH